MYFHVVDIFPAWISLAHSPSPYLDLFVSPPGIQSTTCSTLTARHMCDFNDHAHAHRGSGLRSEEAAKQAAQQAVQPSVQPVCSARDQS